MQTESINRRAASQALEDVSEKKSSFPILSWVEKESSLLFFSVSPPYCILFCQHKAYFQLWKSHYVLIVHISKLASSDSIRSIFCKLNCRHQGEIFGQNITGKIFWPIYFLYLLMKLAKLIQSSQWWYLF